MSEAAKQLREIASIKTSVLYSKRAVLKGAASEIESLRSDLKHLRNDIQNLKAFEAVQSKRFAFGQMIDRIDASLARDEAKP